MKPWSSFLKDVRPDAPGKAEPVIEHAILRALQTFCTETRAWKVLLDPITTQEGVTSYDLDLDNAEVVRLESATLNGQDYAIWRAGDSPRGRYVYTPDGKTVMFAENPEPGLPLVLTCSVTPSNSAMGVDDALYDRYAAVIALGAVVKLTSDPTKRDDYDNQVARIKTRLWRGNAAVRPRARAQFF